MNGSPKSVVTLSRRPGVATRQNGTPEGPSEPQDWVRMMRASEEQTKIVIARAEAALERAANQLDEAHRRTAAAEELWRASEARAQRAEAQLQGLQAFAERADVRAEEAERWLERIHSMIGEFLQSPKLPRCS